jgi:hypothetical protein
MNLEIKIIDTRPCCTEVFLINGKSAKIEDFGYSGYNGDLNKHTCQHWFTPYEIPDSNILKEFEISKGEYRQICEKLKEKLRVTKCAWCS